MIRIKDNVNLKELEKFGWELDTTSCINTCRNCTNHCLVKKYQYYMKEIGDILQYTSIYVSKEHREVYGVFDEFTRIYPDDKDYKYVEAACQDLIDAGLAEVIIK